MYYISAFRIQYIINNVALILVSSKAIVLTTKPHNDAIRTFYIKLRFGVQNTTYWP